jgi:tripartite-type tricarboxylate transporter receptor subunit TctC
VIENRSGGNFNIGSRACAESPPDGYTICIMSNEAVTYNLLTSTCTKTCRSMSNARSPR